MLEATLDTLSTAPGIGSSLSSSVYSSSDFAGRSRLPPIAGSEPRASQIIGTYIDDYTADMRRVRHEPLATGQYQIISK